jgi:predicted peptidase
VKSVTAITEVYGDGQKVTAVAVEYTKSIKNEGLSAASFAVDGHTVPKVYANTSAAKAAQGTDGNYVIIELAVDSVIDAGGGFGAGAGRPEGGGPGAGPGRPVGGSPGDDPGMGPGGDAPPVDETQSAEPEPIRVSVTQAGPLITTDGETYSPDSGAMGNDRVINVVVDDFLRLDYTDPQTGATLMYNLYVPKGYDQAKSYPLVLFIHDAGVSGPQHDKTLTQGLGAVIWATPSEQAKHECFVLAPQYHTVIANDNSETTEYMDMTVDLIRLLETQYSLDTDRLYTTGQSMGCMTSIAMNIKYPDLFAASLLVAGQWDPNAMSVLSAANLWIVVSEGDTKAYPGMNASLAILAAKGAKISRATWDGGASALELASDVNRMLAEGGNINYTVLQGGSHTYTWQVAYSIEGLRDWLFTQAK